MPSGNSNPQVNTCGTITPSDCLTGGIIITLRVELYNNGGKLIDEKTLTLPDNNTFNETFNQNNADYNSIANYKLNIKPAGCSNWILIATGSVQ